MVWIKTFNLYVHDKRSSYVFLVEDEDLYYSTTVGNVA
jgi:hypothetical protein